LVCSKCGQPFSVTRERKKLTGKNIPKYCSTMCSHSRKVSEETRQKISKKIKDFNENYLVKETKIRFKIDEDGNRINPLRIRIRNPSNNNCVVCGNLIERHSKKYCSTNCSIIDKKNIKMADVANGICISNRQLKKYLILTKGHQCSICKNTEWLNEPIPLIMDHIDGRSNNNTLNNLRLVCGNCDMKLPTYKSKNKNSDRKFRKKYYT